MSLPPLPKAVCPKAGTRQPDDLFDEGQMREYGQQCREAALLDSMNLPTKLTHDGAATVAPSLHWIPIGTNPPGIGTKVLVIDDKQRIAYLRDYMPNAGWTHYFPLPTFIKEPDENRNSRHRDILVARPHTQQDEPHGLRDAP